MDNVSIIMPAYNAETLICHSIESVLNQTFRSWELIVVDDGSTDNTERIVNDYSSRDNRIKYFYISNQKQAIARNFGIQKAKYDYLAFLDSDDVWHPKKLESFAKIAKKLPQVDLFFSNMNVVKQHDFLDKNNSNSDIGDISFTVVNDGIKLGSMIYSNYISLSTVILKRTQYTIFYNDFVPAEDFELWLRLLKVRNISICYIKDVLTNYLDNPVSSTYKDRLVVNKILMAINNHITNFEINKLGLNNRIIEFQRIWLKKQLLTRFSKEFWDYYSSIGMSKNQFLLLLMKFTIIISEKSGIGYYGKKRILNFYGLNFK
jgi:teichuronic acid biosynthesis glycosyltransferase TuaG